LGAFLEVQPHDLTPTIQMQEAVPAHATIGAQLVEYGEAFTHR
jgi:hypothetical protein